MRSFIRHAVILSTGLGAAIIAAGCQGKEVTEYVAGVSTQVTVPRDLKTVRVDVSIGGVLQFCRGYKVYNGKVLLPSSLGTFATNTSDNNLAQPITYTIAGLTEENVESDILANCSAVSAQVNSDRVRILRKSRQPYIKDEVLFLPMPLKYACYDKACPPDSNGIEMTCKGGKCVPLKELSADEARATYPRYSPELVDGTGSTCFSTKLCMGARAPAIAVDTNTCTFAVPNTSSAPPLFPGAKDPFNGAPSSGPGINVEVVYDGGLVSEVLDLEPEDGFIVPDATKQVFRLSDGLCQLYKGYEFKVDAQGNVLRDAKGVPLPEPALDSQGNPLKDAYGKPVPKPTPHRISLVRASGTCQPKKPAQPICAADALQAMGLDLNGVTPTPAPDAVCQATEVKPPSAALIVVADSTSSHQAFYDGIKKNTVDLNDPESSIRPAVKAALSDPAFQKTDIGLMYSPPLSSPGDGCGTSAALEVPLGPALSTRDPILDNLSAANPTATNVGIEGALQRAYAELRKPTYDNYFRRAVLVISNGQLTVAAAPQGCGDAATSPSSLAQAASTDAKPIQTYVMQLTKNDKSGAEQLDPEASVLAGSGATGAASYKSDQAADKFREVVNSLASCVYDVDASLNIKDEDKLSFADPLTGTSFKVAHQAGCVLDAPADPNGQEGWERGAVTPEGKQRVFFCPKTCNSYRDILKSAAQFSTLYLQDPLPVPVIAFKAACE